MNTSQWKSKSEKGHSLLMRLMVFLSLALGRRFSRVVLFVIVLFYTLIAKKEVSYSRYYLSKVLNRKPTWIDIYRHFLSFASVLHDRIYWLSNRNDIFSYSIIGADVLDSARLQGKGVILMGAHLGSFEALRSVATQYPNLKVSMLMHVDNAVKIGQVLAEINPEVSQQIIPLGLPNTMLQVQEKLTEGNLVGMLVDRSIHNDDVMTTDFLGEEASFPIGPFRLAAALRVPVVFITGLYLGSNRYELHFVPIQDFSYVERAERNVCIQQAMRNYHELLTNFCYKTPYNWFNFYPFWKNQK